MTCECINATHINDWLPSALTVTITETIGQTASRRVCYWAACRRVTRRQASPSSGSLAVSARFVGRRSETAQHDVLRRR